MFAFQLVARSSFFMQTPNSFTASRRRCYRCRSLFLRESAGISVRELARQIDECHTNVSYWERTGKIPRSDVLLPIATTLGVSVEEILGAVKTKRTSAPAGRMRQLFDAASKLPRSKQEKVLSVLEPFISTHASSRE